MEWPIARWEEVRQDFLAERERSRHWREARGHGEETEGARWKRSKRSQGKIQMNINELI